MTIKPIHNNNNYEAALNEVSSYFENEPEPSTTGSAIVLK